jgi:predicted flap endonuclease-1-like 5' DNA nuclease
VPKVNLLSRHIESSTQVRQANQTQFAQPDDETQEPPASMNIPSKDHDIEVIYGVGKAYAERLEGQGISSTQDLLAYFQRNSTENTY